MLQYLNVLRRKFIMAVKSTPKKIHLNKSQIGALQTRLEEQALTDEDIMTLKSVLDLNFYLQESLLSNKLTISRLKNLFGFKTEKNNKPKKTVESGDNNDGSTEPSDEESQSTTPQGQSESQWDEEQNHGRTAASDYTGLPIEPIGHTDEQILSGSCPDCSTCNSDGRLYPLPPSSVIILESQPLISGTHYQLERSRCRLCNKYYTADLPAHHQSNSKYTYSCYSQIAIWHYYAGVPFKRLEMLQQAQGVPLSDATQYDLIQSMYNDVVKVVVDELRQEAADSTMLFFDDTSATIVEQIIENKKAETKKDKSYSSGERV
jgi:hypothetical protein